MSALNARGVGRIGELFTTACTRIEARATCLSQQTGCRTSCYPPAGFFPPLLREGLRRKESVLVSRAMLQLAIEPLGPLYRAGGRGKGGLDRRLM
jgi:hypothetical protein